MTLDELEWTFAAWCAAGRDAKRALVNAAAQCWFLTAAAHHERRDTVVVGGGALLVPLSGGRGARRALWADEVALLGEAGGTMVRVQAWAPAADRPGSPLQAWTTRVPCWTPLRSGRVRGQAVARSGSA